MRSLSNFASHREGVMDQQQVNSSSSTMYQTSSDSQTPQLSSDILTWTKDTAVIVRRHHMIEGIGRGSLNDLQFRPNAAFHPVREVLINQDQCILQFDRPIHRVDRQISRDELLLLIHSLKRGERELALGQAIYLYPSDQTFGLTSQGELRIVLRNIRPQEQYKDAGIEQVTVFAFLQLIEKFSSQVWLSISPISHQINSLQRLEEVLESPSILRQIAKVTWRLSLYALFLWLVSIPVAIFGPPVLRDPLRVYYHPFFESMSQMMSPHRPAIDSSKKRPIQSTSETSIPHPIKNQSSDSTRSLTPSSASKVNDVPTSSP